MPDPSGKCKPFDITKPFNGSCHDLALSAHSISVFLCLIIIFKYNIAGVYKWILAAMGCVIIYLILSLRKHYTIDIMHAGFYSFFLYALIYNYKIK